MATLSELQAAQALGLTQSYKSTANREAAKIAALIALYYQQRVNAEDPASIERWLEIMIPRLIRASDSEAERARIFFDALRVIETGSRFGATPSLGQIDAGVRKSLLTVGPYDYANKARDIRRLDIAPADKQALLTEAKQVTTAKIAASVVRHAQAGGRQTIYDNAARDETALGWVRVTRENPCFFCAMLASRGVHYRAFQEGSFAESNARFSGDGDAKVHDECGCSLKAVYTENDPVAKRNQTFVDQWSMWGAGGGDAALRFRRGYEHLRKTGEYLTWEQANEGLR